MAKTDKPLISVIVPVYNVEKYIDQCIRSIVSQTYKNLEIILVDDATPDKAGKKCDEWEKKDKRIKVIHKSKNEGLFQARITGFESMHGEYFMTVDSDDYVEPGFVQVFLDRALSTSADITICSAFKVFGESTEQRINAATLRYSSSNVLDGFMNGLGPEKWGWSMWNKMYSSSLYDKSRKYLVDINEKINASEDLLFAVIFCYFARKSSYVDKEYTGYFYRQNPASITGSVSVEALAAKLNDVTKVFFKVENFLKSVNKLSMYQQNIASSRDWHLRVNVDGVGSIYTTSLRQSNAELQQSNAELQQQEQRLQQYNAELVRELQNLKGSKAYKLSRFIASPYNKLRKMLK